MAAPVPPRRNLGLVAALLCVVGGMVGLTYASVPLYRLFCEVTGYYGAPKRVAQAPAEASAEEITVRFNADVNSGMPWRFAPVQGAVTVPLGESTLAFYRAENRSKERIVGTATFNITPLEAGQYFNKIECFCFSQQVLEPGATANLPVTFFVDPAIRQDPDLRKLETITLSYTFFRAADQGTAADPTPVPPAPGS